MRTSSGAQGEAWTGEGRDGIAGVNARIGGIDDPKGERPMRGEPSGMARDADQGADASCLGRIVRAATELSGPKAE